MKTQYYFSCNTKVPTSAPSAFANRQDVSRKAKDLQGMSLFLYYMISRIL